MAGVVAMASVIEDFDTQPCKKTRKDGSSPVVKTITNDFSPVDKAVDKPFSPPRSNNIMNYFSRKGPSSKDKTSPPLQSKESSQSTEKHTSPEAAGKQLPQRRGRKASKAARKLVEAETVSCKEEDCCVIVEPPISKNSAAALTRCSGVLGSDAASLLAKFSADACITTGVSERNANVEQTEKAQCHEDDFKCKNKSELKSISLSPVVPSCDKAKQVKTVERISRRKQEQDQNHLEPETLESESSLCDVSMEDNVDESSELNSSTVTISFEDFVRSQNQDRVKEDLGDEQDKGVESKITAEKEKMDIDQLEIPKAEENIGLVEPSLQVSPRTLTIQAEVHVVSTKQEAVKVVGKLASIFNRRKGANSSTELVSSHTDAGPQLPSTSLTVKRKSNVVVQDEDLELAILESESTPKCSEAERKQFMAAFKQPSLDVSKTKPGKSQGKQKQPEEKNLVAEEDTTLQPSVEQAPAPPQENNLTKKKAARKGRKKAETTSTAPAEEPVIIIEDNKKEPPITSAVNISPVRRSKRQAIVRHVCETIPTTPVGKTRNQKVSMDAAAVLPDNTKKTSTPKIRNPKHGVFVAEMLCPPDTKESPIRMKFTRVQRNPTSSKKDSGSGLNSLTAKKLNESKRRTKAKKLVEKAKVIQQNKKTCAEEKGTLRRSTRNEASIKKSYWEDEDSVICMEEDQVSTPQAAPERGQKSLRSLNDVLGKAKSVPGGLSLSKSGAQGQEKTARKVSIFDESSREGSENSQDDEQFRARREFLKSGLPESFRKQIAKTAATKEAYSLSCSTFQPVLHMKQPPDDCPLWSLPWPESPSLSHLKQLWNQTSVTLSVCASFCTKTKPTRKALCERGSGWRTEISESFRRLLMEEIRTSNLCFPVEMFITRFMKRRTDYQQPCTAPEPTKVPGDVLPVDPVGGKRKRMNDDSENAVKVAKKQRANDSQEGLSAAKRGGQTRRLRRTRLEEEEKAKPSIDTPIPPKDDSVVAVDDLLFEEDAGKKACSSDMVKEDVLWTEKYQPQCSSDILGNTASVRRLHSWLKEWKLRADREESKKQTKDKKQEEGSNDSDWDCGEEDSQDGENMLCNTMLITGPTGVGKTAAVYACAQELGFKVFEVNSSSQRSGRLILSQLKEATQSHQVDSQGVNAHKPTYFNSYGTNSSGSVRPGSSPRKVNSPRRVVSSPRKPPQSPRGTKRGGLAPIALANFFKMGQPSNKQTPNTMKNEEMAASKKGMKENKETANKRKDLTVKSPTTSTPNEEQSKKMATSLILFEEVDVIFDDDSGFLAAIKTFMTTTKRPVILTTSDPAFSSMFDGNFEEIHFKMPSVLNVGSYLQLLCLTEDMRTDLSDIRSLLKLSGCDIRQCLLQLQFWTRSAGGRLVARPLTHTDRNAELNPEIDGEAAETSTCALTVPSTLPPCDVGCTEAKLGLLNIEPERDIWELLRRPVQETVCWELLTDSRRRGVDIFYSNMETLLPLPRTQLTTSTCKSQETRVSVSQGHPSVNPTADCSDDGSPVKVSTRMKKSKKRRRLPDQDKLHTDSDSEDDFLSLCKPQDARKIKEEVCLVLETVKRKPLTPGERAKSLPVSQCLESIADFVDNMSYMDSSLVHPWVNGHMRPVGAVMKDGMTDEARVETDGGSWLMGERILEIQAAVEALSFHKCQASVAEAWDKAQKLDGELLKEATAELTLPVAPHCDGYTFSQYNPCQPQLIQRRREAMESVMLRGVVGTVGNKQAAALDYMPALRTICRSEQLKEQGKVKRRFLHYLDTIQLGLEKSTLQHLAEDFP